MKKFKPSDIVQLLSSLGNNNIMTIENVNEANQTAHCVWHHPTTRKKIEDDFKLNTLKYYKSNAGINNIK
jgi:hypothetical protein